MENDYLNIVMENILYHVQDLGYETAGIINENLLGSIAKAVGNDWTIFSNYELGFDLFELSNTDEKGKEYYDLLFIIQVNEDLKRFNQKDKLIRDIISKYKENVNMFIKKNLSCGEVINSKIIKDIFQQIIHSNIKIVIISKSVSSSLLTEEILSYSDSNLKLKNIKSLIIKENKEIVNNFPSWVDSECNSNIVEELKKENLEYIKKMPRSRVEIVYDFYTLDFKPETKPITVISRTFATSTKKVDYPEMVGNVYSAKLFDLVELYNKKGKNLFLKNIRLGIENLNGVDTAIMDTLSTNPREFWYLNNGVTMLVARNSVISNYNNTLFIKDSGKTEQSVGITVINGAQTISSATKFFVKNSFHEAVKEYAEKYFPNISRDYKVKFEKYNKQYSNAVDEAYVMLKLVEINMSNNNTEIDKKINAITVSLNRQKPVGPVDLAYTLPVISEINKFTAIDNNKLEGFTFTVVRRGDASSINNNRYTLNILPRIMMAILREKPGKAMSVGIKTLLNLNQQNDHFQEKDLFPIKNVAEVKMESSNFFGEMNEEFGDLFIDEELFLSKYKFVNFSMKLYEEIGNLQINFELNYKDNDDNFKYIKKFNSYSKYLLIYIIVYSLLGEGKEIQATSKDFTNWKFNSSSVGEVLDKNKYLKLMKFLTSKWKALLEEKNVHELDTWHINSFKKDDYITDLLKETKEEVREILLKNDEEKLH